MSRVVGRSRPRSKRRGNVGTAGLATIRLIFAHHQARPPAVSRAAYCGLLVACLRVLERFFDAFDFFVVFFCVVELEELEEDDDDDDDEDPEETRLECRGRCLTPFFGAASAMEASAKT